MPTALLDRKKNTVEFFKKIMMWWKKWKDYKCLVQSSAKYLKNCKRKLGLKFEIVKHIDIWQTSKDH